MGGSRPITSNTNAKATERQMRWEFQSISTFIVTSTVGGGAVFCVTTRLTICSDAAPAAVPEFLATAKPKEGRAPKDGRPYSAKDTRH